MLTWQGAKTQCESQLLVNGDLNHEQDATHTVVVRVTDQNGLFKTAKFQISVIDADEPPRVTNTAWYRCVNDSLTTDGFDRKSLSLVANPQSRKTSTTP